MLLRIAYKLGLAHHFLVTLYYYSTISVKVILVSSTADYGLFNFLLQLLSYRSLLLRFLVIILLIQWPFVCIPFYALL